MTIPSDRKWLLASTYTVHENTCTATFRLSSGKASQAGPWALCPSPSFQPLGALQQVLYTNGLKCCHHATPEVDNKSVQLLTEMLLQISKGLLSQFKPLHLPACAARHKQHYGHFQGRFCFSYRLKTIWNRKAGFQLVGTFYKCLYYWFGFSGVLRAWGYFCFLVLFWGFFK